MEQRKNQRFDLNLPYEIQRVGYRTKITGQTRNLSSCGVLFTTGTLIPVGETIEYSIILPKVPGTLADVKIKGVGKVIRRLPDVGAIAVSLEQHEIVREIEQPLAAAAAAAAMGAPLGPMWEEGLRANPG
ncbi:MAG: PilZ domain-containing protein [Acidobacteriota bacterium]